MSWYRSYYTCPRCNDSWEDEWSRACDDDCPACGFRHVSPDDFDDLTVAVEQVGEKHFAVLCSPPDASDRPDYETFAEISNERIANLLARVASKYGVSPDER